jgi:hypothetical protein
MTTSQATTTFQDKTGFVRLNQVGVSLPARVWARFQHDCAGRSLNAELNRLVKQYCLSVLQGGPLLEDHPRVAHKAARRKTVYFDDTTFRALLTISKRRNLPVAALVRQVLYAYDLRDPKYQPSASS